MAKAFVQGQVAHTVSPCTATFGANITVGNVVCGSVRMDANTDTLTAVKIGTTSAIILGPFTSPGGTVTYNFYFLNAPGGSAAVTATSAGSGGLNLRVGEFSGCAGGGALDQSSSSSNASSTTITSGNVTTTNASEVFWGYAYNDSSFGTNTTTGWTSVNGNGSTDNAAWKIATSAGLVAATFTMGAATTSVGSIMTFMDAGAVVAVRPAAITQIRNPDAVPFDGGMQLRRRAIPSNPPIAPQGTHVYFFKNVDGDPFGGHVLLSRPVVVTTVLSSILQRRTLHDFGTHAGGRTLRGDN